MDHRFENGGSAAMTGTRLGWEKTMLLPSPVIAGRHVPLAHAAKAERRSSRGRQDVSLPGIHRAIQHRSCSGKVLEERLISSKLDGSSNVSFVRPKHGLHTYEAERLTSDAIWSGRGRCPLSNPAGSAGMLLPRPLQASSTTDVQRHGLRKQMEKQHLFCFLSYCK